MRSLILVVEDDDSVFLLLKDPIEQLGFDVARAADGATGLELAQRNDYALIILDLNLPQLSGIEVCRRLRQAGSEVPIIMLTAQGSEIDRVLGLELGADDYVAKPFSIRELMARITARLRRHSGASENAIAKSEPSQGEILEFGDLRIDLGSRQAFLGRRELGLTPIEFDLLSLFASNPARALTKEQLLEHVWGGGGFEAENAVTITITRLRRKLGDTSKNPTYISTVRGFGYRFFAHAEPPSTGPLDGPSKGPGDESGLIPDED